MCQPVGLPLVTSDPPAAPPSAAELAELGAHLAGERQAVVRRLHGVLQRRLQGRFTADLVDEVASAWIAEMFRRLALRTPAHRAMAVVVWARLVWTRALASAVREVDCALSAPVRLPKRDTAGVAPGRPPVDDDLVEMPLASHRGARIAAMVYPSAVAEVFAEEPPGEGWRARQRRLRRRASAADELRRVVEGES